MSQTTETVLRIFFIGVGATALMDLWGFLLKSFGIPTLDFAYLGRWVGHMPEGCWAHARIADAAPVKGERWLGWGLHYAIGVAFAALLVAISGSDWARHPRLLPALGVALATVAAPLFIMQPALGAGVASSRTPTPLRNILKSLANHAVFGLGLYLAAAIAA